MEKTVISLSLDNKELNEFFLFLKRTYGFKKDVKMTDIFPPNTKIPQQDRN